MMANPIPKVPDLPKTFQDVEEVKMIQPRATPRPVPEEPPLKEIEEIKKEEIGDIIGDIITTQPEPETSSLYKEEVPPEAPGLLSDLMAQERLSVTRQLQVRKVMSLQGKKNIFYIRTPAQELVYTVEEENSWWVGYLCYGLRPMWLKVMNNAGNEVIRISRPYSFTTRILPCQLQRLQVFSPPGHLIGSVQQQWTPIRPVYVVKNFIGAPIFTVQGPRVTLSCFQDVQFQVRRPDGTLVAATNKRWEGLVHLLFFAPVRDKFGMTFFEKEMKGEERALLLAMALLLDYMYYDV